MRYLKLAETLNDESDQDDEVAMISGTHYALLVSKKCNLPRPRKIPL
jgi:hypothetical protein